MKQTIFLLIITALINASEFKYIQPLAVENAPVKEQARVEKPPLILEKDSSAPIEIEEESSITNDAVQDINSTQAPTLSINFNKNKGDISDKYLQKIQELSLFLKDNKGYLVLLYGHTDSTENNIPKKELSRNRANGVKILLQNNGVKSVRITVIAKGDTQAIAENTSRKGRAMNRRVEVDLLE